MILLSLLPYSTLPTAGLALLLLAGLFLLYYGGDFLCDGASNLALRLKVSPIVVGLTIVAMATSFPELLTSLYAVVQGNSGLAIGNIIGSNLANIGLILGLAAIVYPLTTRRQLIQQELPILIFATLLFTLVSLGGVIGRLEGTLLLLVMSCYLAFLLRQAKRLPPEELPVDTEDLPKIPFTLLKCSLLICLGALLLIGGTEFLVGSAIETALRLGVDEVVIGLTIVAVGTSLPELSASLVSALKRQSDIAVGNIIGSNIFNMLFIGGTVAIVRPLEIKEELLFQIEYPAMILLTILLWGLFYTDHRVSRYEGALLIILYALIIAFSVLMRAF